MPRRSTSRRHLRSSSPSNSSSEIAPMKAATSRSDHSIPTANQRSPRLSDSGDFTHGWPRAALRQCAAAPPQTTAHKEVSAMAELLIKTLKCIRKDDPGLDKDET